MALDVIVKITLTKPIGKVGFGIPLILVSKATENKGYKEYSNISELASDYPSETEVYKAAALIWRQEEAPSKIAVCSSTEKATDALDNIYHEGWRQLITLLGETGDSTIPEVSAYMETKADRLYFTSFNNAAALESALGDLELERTVAMVHATAVCPEAALVGATAGRDAGSFTYKNMVLYGIEPENLTNAVIEEIHEAGGIAFVTKSGDNVTSEGKATGGEYIDIVDSKDYIVMNIRNNVQKLLNTLPKVPFDDKGIAMIETQVVDVLNDAYSMGIILTNAEGLPDYSTSFALRSGVPDGERAERKYNHGTFKFGLAGAVHNVEVNGEIVV